jgi:drug/metabolite transporter (DMT)-like permease
MAVTFGLIAALCWGLGDFLSRFSARGLGAWRSTFFGQMPGALVISSWLLLDTAHWPRLAAAPPSIWVLA